MKGFDEKEINNSLWVLLSKMFLFCMSLFTIELVFYI